MEEIKFEGWPLDFEEMEKLRDWLLGRENDLALGLTLEGATYDELDEARADVLKKEQQLLVRYGQEDILVWRNKREALKQANLIVADLKAGDPAYEWLLCELKRDLYISGATLTDIGTSESKLAEYEKLGRCKLIARLTNRLRYIILGLHDGNIVKAANQLAKEWNKNERNPIKRNGLPVTDYDVVKHIEREYDPRFIYKTMVINITLEAHGQTIVIH